jgi:iron complex transport system substrate-binding protein
MMILGLFAPALEAQESRQILDDEGRKITLERSAGRIIPLYGAFAEMLFEVGAGGQVIARTQADQFPPAVTRLPAVGTHMRPNVEMIIGLKPDLVVQSGTRLDASPEMERVRQAGIPVAVFAPSDFQGIFSTMERLGVLAGCPAQAGAAVEALRERLARARNRVSTQGERKRVFFEVRSEPLTAAGRGSIVQQILSAAGAENVVKGDRSLVQYSLEQLLLDDPDVYLVQRGPMSRNPVPPRQRPHFERLRAIREGKILMVDEFIFSRPGPRSVEAVEILAAELYPDVPN